MREFCRRQKRNIIGTTLLILGSGVVLVWGAVFAAAGKADVSIHFFDVGQGDSEFIETRDGTQILIDGGPSSKVLQLLGSTLPYYDRSIDVMILTHPHSDHVSGLIDVLKRYQVGMIIEDGVAYHTPEAEAFETIVAEKHIKKIIVDRHFSLSFFNGAMLTFLFPERSYEGQSLKNVHDAMVVSEFLYRGTTVLLMGDAEKGVEHHLVSSGIVGDVDILKIGHHGSKTSSIREFLAATHPEYAIVSVGKNKYGHPNDGVLSRLASIGATVFRTDRNGTITADFRDGSFTIKAEK